MKLVCAACNRHQDSDSLEWRCSCGAPWNLECAPPTLLPDNALHGLWRWHGSLPPIPAAARVSLGEGGTPLVPTRLAGEELLLKCDFCNPTGSWKDRGWTVAVSHLQALGISRVYEDSSGNAGASLAAYGARAGMAVTVYVPADSPEPKRRQVAAYGARLVPVSGGRDAVAAACVEAAAAEDGFYAGHAWNPWFHWGPRTLAWELLEDLQGDPPDAVVMPAGQGGILMGLAAGFAALRDAGIIDTLPRLIAAQADACSPLVQGWKEQASAPPPLEVRPTLADAIRTPRPVRYSQALDALRLCDGLAMGVSEEEIATSHRQLAGAGLLVEPTSAVAAAAAVRYRRSAAGAGQRVAVILTGFGLKALGEKPDD